MHRCIVATQLRRGQIERWLQPCGSILFHMVSRSSSPRVISFDAEGTLATHDFSIAVWQEVVPSLYAETRGIDVQTAKQVVFAEFMRIGMRRREWFDIDYWFDKFGLGPAAPVIEANRHRIEFYPDAVPVLEKLRGKYQLVVASSTPHEFLEPLLRDVQPYFTRMFSATSEFGVVKDARFFEWMCSELQVEPSAVVHVGDSWQKDHVSSGQAGLVSFFLDREHADGSSLHSLWDLVAALENGVTSGLP